jgi:hypothetical protein
MGAEVGDEIATRDTLAEGSADAVRCQAGGRRGVALEHLGR